MLAAPLTEVPLDQLASKVGRGCPNRSSDVKTVQSLLNRNLGFLIPLKTLDVDGAFGPLTHSAIVAFQTRVAKLSAPDGVVSPTGVTLQLLAAHVSRITPTSETASPQSKLLISDEQYVEAARQIACEAAAIAAVATTETLRSAFDERGRPTILFERHIFSSKTQGRFDKSHYDLSQIKAGGYGHYSEQYGKLERAMKLDREAALQSTSWGTFQIMGFNFARCGFSTVDLFVDAMKSSAEQYLQAFVAFILSDTKTTKALRLKDWKLFAQSYNGPGYAENNYAGKMKTNYEALTKTNQPSLSSEFKGL